MQFTQIDLETATPENVKSEIARLKDLANMYKNMDQGLKLSLNSIYGSTGNKWFVAYNVDVAGAITAQGRDLIKYAEVAANEYFYQWHTYKEMHEKIGIKGDVRHILKPVVVYIDTDSNYLSYEEVVKSCEWPGSPKDSILAINEHGFKQYLEKKMEEYSEKWHTDRNYQDFELESINFNGIWLEKKKYILETAWEVAAGGGIDYDPLKNMIYKGVELAQSVTPPFSRKKLDELIKYIFSKGREIKTGDLAAKLKAYKTEFKVSEPEDICRASGITDYSTHVINDATGVELKSATPFHIRAAAYYNYALNSNPKYKEKYEMIKSGTKIKFYYTDNNEENVFAFIPGSFPYEFAPKIDYDMQFAKTIIDPLNRILKALDLPVLSNTLSYPTALF